MLDGGMRTRRKTKRKRGNDTGIDAGYWMPFNRLRVEEMVGRIFLNF